MREDKVEIYGSKGKITFSVFENDPLILTNDIEQKILNIEHPENIQLYHAQLIREHLLGNTTHPSTGITGTHTNWVMDKIIGNI
nr:hypothetical protein [uncultured Flavobacterium sp.]